MRKTVTWIVIADGVKARIVANEGAGKGLTAVPGHAMATPPHAERDGYSDRPGRVHESSGSSRHAIQPRLDWHRFEKQQFAKHVAGMLDAEAGKGAFDRLILVAPPRTLGDLRGALAASTRAKVTGEIDKDLTHLGDHDLPSHLDKVLVL
jgi:protein required for attachment to host cells